MPILKYKTQNGYEPIPAQVIRKSNEENGFGAGTCSTSSGTALTAAITGYELVANGFVEITFENAVPADATLNINSKGAKAIYYKGAAITAGIISAGDVVMLGYDGTNYTVCSIVSKVAYDYSDIGYAVNTDTVSGAVSISGATPLHVLDVSANVSSVSLSANPPAGHSCHVIFTAASAVTVEIAYDSTDRVTPDGQDISIEIPAGGYAEVDFLSANNKVYVRGV